MPPKFLELFSKILGKASGGLHQRQVWDTQTCKKTLKYSLRLFSYKIRNHQPIPVKAVQQRVDFVIQIPKMFDKNGFDVSFIWITDKGHFCLNGIVNKPNKRVLKFKGLLYTLRVVIIFFVDFTRMCQNFNDHIAFS